MLNHSIVLLQYAPRTFTRTRDFWPPSLDRQLRAAKPSPGEHAEVFAKGPFRTHGARVGIRPKWVCEIRVRNR
jgi:hypothetical protein